MKIGITECGEPSKDFSWINKMNDVDGAILITKNIDSIKFQESIVPFYDKIIIHATITGMGGTDYEPNVSESDITIKEFNKLSNIISKDRMVLRIDPIIPVSILEPFIEDILNSVEEGVRLKFSFIDQYKHLKDRNVVLPWNSFNSPESEIIPFINLIKKYSNKFTSITTCAEKYSCIPNEWKIGCLSDEDFKVLGLETPKYIKGSQRFNCLCFQNKIQLINKRKRCANKCLYCYWKEDE